MITPAPAPGPAPAHPTEEVTPFPWHLKLLAGAIAVYLLFRLVQGIEWVLG